ncbi:MAG TPA: lipid-A-disaccharide synthase [Thermoanaerobaculaceae bacterium]|nr:lipid-A-disaccharide synthase [Thermoanaerobaculaceae bacterium]HRS16644.1 lipid-A-disaccharide synthase [Thermoanaerobaculaceae bacterium]
MKLLVVAGEASGDLHAANLLAALQRAVPGVEAFGVGGERLRAEGLECVARSEELSVMGLAEVLRHLPRLLGVARRVRREAVARRPDIAVLVDSPDFNLPLATHLRRARIPVAIYISPQLWAWRPGRVARIRRDVRRVLCILPFEVEFFERHGVAAEYVGHPLVDELEPVMAAPAGRDPEVVALLPGSRWHEVAALLPGMAGALQRLAGRRPRLRGRLIVAPGLEAERLLPLLGAARDRLEVVVADRHRALSGCAAAMVASGTATLECALLGVPMVVGYRLHGVTYALARRLVKVPHVALANLVAGERLAAELVQDLFTPERLAAEIDRLLGEDGEAQRRGLKVVRERLGPAGASARAAAAVAALAGRTR